MRKIDGRPWRFIRRFAALSDGRELFVLSCSHERIDPPAEDRLPPKNMVRCSYCIGGVDAVVPIEQVPA